MNRFAAVPRVTRLLPERPGGTSNPMWCECDDGVERIVKWHRGGPKTMYRFSHGPKTCFNELVASRLGLVIAAPVIRASVVLVPAAVIGDREHLDGALPGLHCGIARIAGRDVPGKDGSGSPIECDTSRIANREQLATASLLLAWLQIEDHAMQIANGSPAYDNGIFFERTRNGEERYVLLDLEHAFGTPEWTTDSLRPADASFVLPTHLKAHLEGMHQEDRAHLVARLSAIDLREIKGCFEDYPVEWCGTADMERARDWVFERARLLGRWFSLDGHTVRVTPRDSRWYP